MNSSDPVVYYHPSVDDAYEQSQGNVSLPFSLFRLAPPEVALRMMEDGLILDLNEKSAKNVPLVAVKAYGLSVQNNVPTYDELQSSQDEAWSLHNPSPTKINQIVLITSMIMAGADPWTPSWDRKDYDHRHDNLFSLAVSVSSNPSFLKFLLSHPQCPSAEALQKNRITAKMSGDSWNSSTSLEQAPLLHVVSNSGYDEALKLLLAKGLDVNEVDEHGRHALFYVQSPTTAKILIDHGANVHLKDASGKSVAQFWKRTFHTAAKQSEMNKILIEEMKASMSPEELREAQKPLLFNEILKGTKTSFEGIYRKAKFDPSVTHVIQGLDHNLITAALRRNDDKTPLFLNWCKDKKVSWGHELWKDEPLGIAPMNNALYSVAILSNKGNGVEPGIELLQEQYGTSVDPVKDLYNDVMLMNLKLVQGGSNITRTLNWLVGHDRYQDDVRQSRSEYQVGYGMARFKAFLRQVHIIAQIPFEDDLRTPPPQLYNPDQNPLYHTLLQQACRALLKHNLGTLHAQQNSSYLNLRTAFQEDLYQATRTKMLKEIENGRSEAKTSLAWLIMLGYASNYTEKNMYHKTTSALFQQRLEDLELLKSWSADLNLHGDDFVLMEEYLSKYIEKIGEYVPSAENAQSVFSSIDLSRTVNRLTEAQQAPSSSRRRM